MVKLITLKKRSDFLRLAASGHKAARANLVLQAAPSTFADGALHVGFTATKKLGGAVVRNRAKRRLRALVRERLPSLASPGIDYVLIARKNCVHSPYDALCKDLESAVKQLNKAMT